MNYFEYILDKRTAAKAFALTDAPLVFIGHTHIAEYWVQEPDGSVGHRHMQHGGELRFEEGQRYIVDVGSVGQPRDLNPEASFVFYDPQKRTVEWVRYPYPISRSAREDSRCASSRLSCDAFGVRTVSIPVDDGNCFACGPENPIGLHLHFERRR